MRVINRERSNIRFTTRVKGFRVPFTSAVCAIRREKLETKSTWRRWFKVKDMGSKLGFWVRVYGLEFRI